MLVLGQRAQRLERRADAQLDLFGDAGLAPSSARPIDVHSSLTSQHSSLPSSGRPRAMHSAE